MYAKDLPESMDGETFLKEYGDHNDSVTVINPNRTYGIKAPTKHPIYENFRVEVFIYFHNFFCQTRKKFM